MIKWTLKNYLDANGVTAYRLAQATDVSPTTVYALARGEHERISLAVLDKVLGSLERLTGKPATPNDLLEHQPDPEPMDHETRAWMDAPIDAPLEPYDWAGADPETLGEMAIYKPGVGWIVGE